LQLRQHPEEAKAERSDHPRKKKQRRARRGEHHADELLRVPERHGVREGAEEVLRLRLLETLISFFPGTPTIFKAIPRTSGARSGACPAEPFENRT
jgi:hypothetical protein